MLLMVAFEMYLLTEPLQHVRIFVLLLLYLRLS